MQNVERIATKYLGTEAEGYEARRSRSPQWRREQRVFADFLASHEVTRCLDVPVGTGRFLPLYDEHGIDATGVDVSPDMLAEASKRAADLDSPVDLRRGSVMDLPFGDRSFDLVVCWRLLNWLSPRETEAALAELTRLSRAWVVVTIRHRPRTLRAWAAEAKRALVRRTGGHASFGHRERDVRAVFRELGLSVRGRTTLHERPAYMEHVAWTLHV